MGRAHGAGSADHRRVAGEIVTWPSCDRPYTWSAGLGRGAPDRKALATVAVKFHLDPETRGIGVNEQGAFASIFDSQLNAVPLLDTIDDEIEPFSILSVTLFHRSQLRPWARMF